MIKENNVIVLDIDNTLCEIKGNKEYIDLLPKYDVLDKVKEYKKKGFYIILFTARQMKSHQGNIGKINTNTGKVLFSWLEKYEIPYDEIHFGKPWCGNNGFYVDDKAIRPNEFVELSFDEITKLISEDKQGE